MNKKLVIPVALDYGAEEYFWYCPFSNTEALKSWWLSGFDLLEFERKVETSEDFENVTGFESFYELVNSTGLGITMIDACNSSYLIIEKEKIFPNGEVKILPRSLKGFLSN